MSRRPVFVRTKECYVEVVPWEGVIVWVSAEESTCNFRCKHQAKIGIFFVAIELVDSPAIKSNRLAAQSCLLALLFDSLQHNTSCVCCFRRCCHWTGRSSDAGSNVLHTLKHFHLHPGTFDLFSGRLRVEPRLHQVFVFCRCSNNAFSAHMMIGENQAIRRNKRARVTHPNR